MRRLTFIYILLTTITLTTAAQNQKDIYYDISQSIDIFGRVYKEITLKYVDEIDPKEFMLAGIEGMLDALDPYTVYIDESSQKDIDLMTTGKYGGIGATIGLRNEKITVVDLIEGYSAQRQGIRIGDVIIKIDSVKVNKDNYEDLSLYMKGEPGTMVSVTVRREAVEEDIVFDLLREEVVVKNLTYYGFLPKDSNIAYLKLSSFNRTAGEEVKDALFELKGEKEIQSVILDLRGNPGGLLDAAIDVTDKFVEKGQLVVKVIGRNDNDIQEYFAKEEPIIGDANLIVLVDGGSASASEIVAGAIQDHDRGVILGEPSFGKGLVQNVIPLTSTTSLKMTTGKYFTPSGRSIQKQDYAENSDVFIDTTGRLIHGEFRTDGNRVVYAGGGVEPDTVVSNQSHSDLIKSLIAQGVFFKFATNYFNQNDEIIWQNLDSHKTFKEFSEYYFSNDFIHTSKTEKLVADLKAEMKKNNLNGNILEKFKDFENAIADKKQNELVENKDVVLSYLHQEIAARTDGRTGRIEASFNYDKQLSNAINILEKKDEYISILALAKEKTN